ncbi:transmembrane protein 25 [Nothoprocta perdicaria]|uniref:transmembrane protein 25 n=1 Tax=Nothoprocta perdicaria TaxID=30464 RepID=UPI000E1C2A53|nr:transmembrane protein 25 [Nothoprocta perdicaria]
MDGRARALRDGERWPFTCRAPLPATALAWYLDGRPHQPDSLAEPGAPSTFTLPARRADRQLTCALAPAVPGATDASVHFDVQLPPEILRTDTHPAEVAAPGLLVVLLAPVQANPPAAITWLGPDGRPVVNTSLLAPDANGHPALTNHTVHLSALPGTFSVHATNGLGVANASIPAPGLWDARVELPLLGVAAGVAVVLGALLGLGCVAARRHAKPGTGLPGPAASPLPPSCPGCSQLPREHRSLPPNLRLSDLAQEPRGSPGATGEEAARLELEKGPVLVGLGFVRLPATGYIYKVSSTSSDEIWL